VKGVPFYRDFIMLAPFKLLRRNIVIHLHGKGIADAARNSWIDRSLYKLFFSNVSVICLSDRLTDDVRSVFDGPIYIVNNGIKSAKISVPDRRRDVPVILFLSNMVESKGIFIVLEAARILMEKGCSFMVHLAGAPRGDVAQRISDYVLKYQLGGVVSLLGPKYEEEKIQTFVDADVFVFPTKNDTWGLVVNEAMQASLPVISSAEGSLPEIVDDGITGFLLKDNTPEELAEKIEVLLCN